MLARLPIIHDRQATMRFTSTSYEEHYEMTVDNYPVGIVVRLPSLYRFKVNPCFIQDLESRGQQHLDEIPRTVHGKNMAVLKEALVEWYEDHTRTIDREAFANFGATTEAIRRQWRRSSKRSADEITAARKELERQLQELNELEEGNLSLDNGRDEPVVSGPEVMSSPADAVAVSGA